MFSAIGKFINEKIFGKVVHTYDPIKVKHGNVTCHDDFLLREKNGRRRLFQVRVWEDGHDVQRYCPDYDKEDVDALHGVFQKSLEQIAQDKDFDFGVILKEQDGGMQSVTRFYVEQSGGELYLFARMESQAKVVLIDEMESSENTDITYYPTEEVEAIAGVLADAQQRMLVSQ
jgi:hypothetical protein